MRLIGKKWYLIACIVIAGGCATLQMLTHDQLSPHESYFNGLKKSTLIKSAMVARWIAAGTPALHDSLIVNLPFSETGVFPASEPQARFYRVEGKEGQIIAVKAFAKSKEHGQLFIDLFSLENGTWKLMASADTSLRIKKELVKNSSLLLRLQPELLINIYYSVSVGGAPALIIPVKGASNKDIGSFYDDTRTIDGKIRKHEGVDIFAKKGTYVIAPTDGFVSRVTTNSLGGKVIWMKDAIRAPSYYFAHLDSQIAKPGTNVRQGDILGTVGNSGNAKFTPSHLHFGVYLNTSVDPIAFIRANEIRSPSQPDTLFVQQIFRVNQKTASLQSGAFKKASVRETLIKDTWLKMLARSNDTWCRVATADDHEGFIERSKLMSTEKGTRVNLKSSTPLLADPSSDAIAVGSLSGPAERLATFKTFQYIKTTAGISGWISAESVR